MEKSTKNYAYCRTVLKDTTLQDSRLHFFLHLMDVRPELPQWFNCMLYPAHAGCFAVCIMENSGHATHSRYLYWSTNDLTGLQEAVRSTPHLSGIYVYGSGWLNDDHLRSHEIDIERSLPDRPIEAEYAMLEVLLMLDEDDPACMARYLDDFMVHNIVAVRNMVDMGRRARRWSRLRDTVANFFTGIGL